MVVSSDVCWFTPFSRVRYIYHKPELIQPLFFGNGSRELNFQLSNGFILLEFLYITIDIIIYS